MGLRKVEIVVVVAVLVSDSKCVSKEEVALSSMLQSFRIVERLQSEIGRGTRRTFYRNVSPLRYGPTEMMKQLPPDCLQRQPHP